MLTGRAFKYLKDEMEKKKKGVNVEYVGGRGGKYTEI